MPAAFSPSEIKMMFDMGADIVKVFPAGQLGPDYVKAVQAPLGKLRLWSWVASERGQRPELSSTRAPHTLVSVRAFLIRRISRHAIARILQPLSSDLKKTFVGKQTALRGLKGEKNGRI